MNNWYITTKGDQRARRLADRHYSRQSVGNIQFTAPGNNIVLIIPSRYGSAADALWVSQRVDPSANLPQPRADGMDCWNNSYFRNETGIRSSDLIREAVAITKHIWGDVPKHGLHTFVDPTKVQGVKVRGSTVHGFCFMKAGFRLSPQITQTKSLLRWILSKRAIEQIEATEPLHEQPLLFASL